MNNQQKRRYLIEQISRVSSVAGLAEVMNACREGSGTDVVRAFAPTAAIMLRDFRIKHKYYECV